MGRAEEAHFGLQEALRREAFVTFNTRSFKQKIDPVFHEC
jgi:hypothetical protein